MRSVHLRKAQVATRGKRGRVTGQPGSILSGLQTSTPESPLAPPCRPQPTLMAGSQGISSLCPFLYCPNFL